MSDDLLNRLRAYRSFDEWGDVHHPICDEAADELARLRAEVERLKNDLAFAHAGRLSAEDALADERAHADALAGALGQAVKALEMVTDQNAIKSTSVANAFAACVEAASIGRKALSDQNPIKNRARRQG